MKGERICFIMDESNVLDSSFLERMNTLLANGEVPGLFEGDEMTMLMTQCKEGAQREGLMLDSQEELYKWFTQQVSSSSSYPVLVFKVLRLSRTPDSGVGNTWQRLTLVLHEFLSNWLTPSRLHIVISFLTHVDHVFLGLPRSLVPGSSNRLMELMPVPPKMPSAKNSRDLV